MRYRFGLLPRLNFLQDLASVFIANIIPEVIHNLEKYMAIKKVHHLSAIEEIKGDYLEFGVFTGSSFCHSIRCVKNIRRSTVPLAPLDSMDLILSRVLGNYQTKTGIQYIKMYIMRLATKRLILELEEQQKKWIIN